MRTPALVQVLAAAVLLAALTGCGAAGAAGGADDVPAGTTIQRIEVDGLDRDYRLHTPAGLTGAAPLVLVLHGGFGSGEQAERAYGWNEIADTHGVVVAYPNGLGRAWNAGDGCCGRSGADGVDDVAYLEAVVADIRSRLAVDDDRVFATGMSNGAMMSYRLACDTDLFAAIGPVAGTILGECDDPLPVSVLHIHGLADSSVRMDGGEGDGRVRIDGAPVRDVVAAWRLVDDCGEPVVAGTSTSTGPVTDAVAECADGRTVELVTIDGAGHQWPGSEATGRAAADVPSSALDATARLWEFFAAHPRP